MENAYPLLLAGTITVNALLITILLLRRVIFLSLVFFIVFLLLIDVWAVPAFVLQIVDFSPAVFRLIDKISALGYVFVPISFYLFSLSVTNRLDHVRRASVQLLIFAPSLVFLFLAWTTDYIIVHDYREIIVRWWGISSPAGGLFLLFLLWFESIMVVSLILMWKEYKALSDNIRKKQIYFLMLAILIPLIVGSVTNGILPLLEIYVFPAAIPLVSLTGVIVVFTMMRFGLFEMAPWDVVSGFDGGIIGVDSKGRILQMNSYARQVLLQEESNPVGNAMGRVFRLRNEKKKNFSRKNNPVFRAIRKNISIKGKDYYLQLRDKKMLPVEVAVRPLVMDEEVWGATITFQDNTIERELEKSRENFISMASHELRTPLTTMRLQLKILSKKLMKSGKREYEEQIQKLDDQIERLNVLASDLLDATRIQSGSLEYEKKEIALSKVIKEAVDDLNMGVAGGRAENKFRSKAKVLGDERRIYQVLSNLITNAVKYSSESDKVIVGGRETGTHVTFYVRDYGSGIPDEEKERIFDRYYRVSEGSAHGFGVGLSIASEIVRDHSGKLRVESKVGKGSTFFVDLPKLKNK